MIAAVQEVAGTLGIVAACLALLVPRATFYRRQRPVYGPHPKRPSPRALLPEERSTALALLHEDRFVDKAPAQVWATLLDEGRYVCSERTMYRLLAAAGEVRERRAQLVRPAYAKPELLARGPNQVWSWDVTKLLGPVKWTYFYLYALIDIFSRYVVGWLIAEREDAELGKALVAQSVERQGIQPGQLTVHGDRGAIQTAKAMALLMADLGVTKTHSRPHVSDDNPFSESAFKTWKYRPDMPERFGCVQDARGFFRRLFDWYHFDHRHSGLGLLTPYEVHHGLAPARLVQRAAVLESARARHPERFVQGRIALPAPPTEVWINPPRTPAERARAEARDVVTTAGPREGLAGAGQAPAGAGAAAPVEPAWAGAAHSAAPPHGAAASIEAGRTHAPVNAIRPALVMPPETQ